MKRWIHNEPIVSSGSPIPAGDPADDRSNVAHHPNESHHSAWDRFFPHGVASALSKSATLFRAKNSQMPPGDESEQSELQISASARSSLMRVLSLSRKSLDLSAQRLGVSTGLLEDILEALQNSAVSDNLSETKEWVNEVFNTVGAKSPVLDKAKRIETPMAGPSVIPIDDEITSLPTAREIVPSAHDENLLEETLIKETELTDANINTSPAKNETLGFSTGKTAATLSQAFKRLESLTGSRSLSGTASSDEINAGTGINYTLPRRQFAMPKKIEIGRKLSLPRGFRFKWVQVNSDSSIRSANGSLPDMNEAPPSSYSTPPEYPISEEVIQHLTPDTLRRSLDPWANVGSEDEKENDPPTESWCKSAGIVATASTGTEPAPCIRWGEISEPKGSFSYSDRVPFSPESILRSNSMRGAYTVRSASLNLPERERISNKRHTRVSSWCGPMSFMSEVKSREAFVLNGNGVESAGGKTNEVYGSSDGHKAQAASEIAPAAEPASWKDANTDERAKRGVETPFQIYRKEEKLATGDGELDVIMMRRLSEALEENVRSSPRGVRPRRSLIDLFRVARNATKADERDVSVHGGTGNGSGRAGVGGALGRAMKWINI
ncbi:hypothetical protein BJ742DRAFT_816637, partial [Cladochytrium replicatum]